MSDLIPFEYDGQLVVDSRLIAEEIGIQHDNFMQTVYNYQTQSEKEFGIYLFQTDKLKGRGRPQKYVLLTEDQSTFLMTLSANTPQVVQCKVKLVKGFSQAKQLLKAKIDTSYWYKRIGLAMSDIDKPLKAGYFCVYLEMMRFFSELEMRFGYVFPDKDILKDKYIIVDISIGGRFNEWLRSDDKIAYLTREEFLGSGEPIDFRRPSDAVPEGGKHRHEIEEYNHVYPLESHSKRNIHPANGYPNKYRAIFNHYLEEYYIPDRFLKYIKERDPKGIEEIKKTILAMSDSTKKSLSVTLVGRFIRGLLPPAK